MPPNRLPRRLQKLWPYAVESGRDHGVDPVLILAVLDQEGLGGETLRPKGPGGTGDWTPRKWSRYHGRADALTRFRHWRPSRDEYERIFKVRLEEGATVPELCMPSDGLGWGRGLAQADWADPANEEFLAKVLPDGTPAWKDAASSVDFCAGRLRERIVMFDGDEFIGTAGYNAHPDNINRALLAITHPATDAKRHAAVDRITTAGKYASDCLGRRRHFQTLLSFPGEDT